MIDALTEDGRVRAEAIRLAGVLEAEHAEWRRDYAGLVRTLGPLAAPRPRKRPGR